jgi:phenylacetate-CoA ligase
LKASGHTERESLVSTQARRLSELLRRIHGRNPFYSRKLDAAGVELETLSFPRDLSRLPFTAKHELMADQRQAPPWGTNLTEPIEHYTRYNQTSSTTGSPLRWLDTNESWQWMLECWKAVYGGANVTQPIGSFFHSRSGRSWASGRPSRPAARSARIAFRPAVCRVIRDSR